MFADISGFSELTGQMDAEELLEVVDPVVAALSNVVGRYGGVVEKFAGDAVLALFGAPLAHDDDASRALRVALEMHRELAAVAPELDLQLHIGVNSGHGIGRVLGSEVRLDYGVLGDVVVLAQRFESAAPAGETYVGETTYELTQKEFDFEPLDELVVKGRRDPVRAWRLVGPKQTTATSSPAPALAGRERELETLLDLVAQLVDGRGGAGFVVGEPGIGKTALCQAVRAHSEAAGCEWLSARCVSYGGELAYWPFAELLRRLFGLSETSHTGDVELLREQLVPLGLEESLPFVAVLCGVDGAPSTALDAQSLQVRVHESVVAVLGALAARRPTVLHLDDLQWADGPTATLVGSVLDATRAAPLALLVSARPEAAALVHDLDGSSAGSRFHIELQRLGDDAVAEIAAHILGSAAAPALVEELVERTRGNPFFVEEITRALAERADLVQRGGEWHIRPGWESEQVPLTVERVLAARIDALGERERDALEILSIIGRRADRELARALSGGIDGAVPTLVAAGFLDPANGALAFHHPLIQQVVYSRLLRRRRASLHRLVGETAEALYGADEALVDLFARHFYLGESAEKAYPYLLRAAGRAEGLFANEQALTHLRRALELVDASAPERTELVLRCARIEEIIGAYQVALSLYHEVLEATGELRAALGEAAVLRKLGEYDRCLATLERARAAHPDPTPAETAGLALEEGWVLALRGQNQAGVEILERGLAAVAGGDDRLEGHLLVTMARNLENLERNEEALIHAERARLLFERIGDLPRLTTALRVLGAIQAELAPDDRESLQRSRSTLEQALSLARRVGNAEEQAASLINLSNVLALIGDVEAALDADRQALAAFEGIGLKAGIACAYHSIGDHLVKLGRWQAALDAARKGLAVAEEIENANWLAGSLEVIAKANHELGNHAAAAAVAEEAADRALACGMKARERDALQVAVEALEALGHSERADKLRGRAAGLERQ